MVAPWHTPLMYCDPSRGRGCSSQKAPGHCSLVGVAMTPPSMNCSLVGVAKTPPSMMIFFFVMGVLVVPRILQMAAAVVASLCMVVATTQVVLMAAGRMQVREWGKWEFLKEVNE